GCRTRAGPSPDSRVRPDGPVKRRHRAANDLQGVPGRPAILRPRSAEGSVRSPREGSRRQGLRMATGDTRITDVQDTVYAKILEESIQHELRPYDVIRQLLRQGVPGKSQVYRFT